MLLHNDILGQFWNISPLGDSRRASIVHTDECLGKVVKIT